MNAPEVEHRLRSVHGVLACAVADGHAHLLVEGGRAARRATAQAERVADGLVVHVTVAEPPAARRMARAGRDLLPVLGVAVGATVLAATGSAVLARALDPAPADPRIGATRAAPVDRPVRTAPAAPERLEVLGEQVEAPPAP